ncbi:MAG: PfkB family carbohydrate kinase [Candidatus Neomarinimicrobiota bacterium]
MKNYDIVIFGNYTKDTIISAAGTRYVDGGGFNYGAHAAACSGLKVAAVTRLAREDDRVIRSLESAGIDVYPTFTESSTHMRLEYPTDNVDERVLTCPVSAGTYTIDQFAGLEARAYLINASIRHEVPYEIVKFLADKDGLVVADAQGFIRIVGKDNVLVNAEWPEKRKVLALIDIFKADIVEAESLTGEGDLRRAAEILAGWGPQEIVLTHRDGIVVFAEGEFHAATFYPEPLIGRSGRGDTCIASYAARRLSAPPAEAIIWSAALTSLKMEAEGPIKKTAVDVENLIKRKYSTGKE